MNKYTKLKTPFLYRDAVQIKTKTSDLMGEALNWAVGMAHEWKRYDSPFRQPDGQIMWTLMVDDGGKQMQDFATFEPSTDWAQGGPIIERHIFRLEDDPELGWLAEIGTARCRGNTALVAAMRCYVASKLGDEVEIPEELLKATA